ncbi:MAG: hypothetical protein JWO53_1327 [Chlamydiia bacterium]|nr:hypothetical protein [Chlamydiia bacterium]
MIICLLIALILLLTLSSAFCSLSEVAFFSLPSSRVKAYRHQLDPRKRQVAKLLKESKSLLVTIFLLNTVVNILVQNITSDLFEPIQGGWILKVGVPLVLILVCGELLPKYLGLLYNEQIALFSAPFYDWFQKISAPLRLAITYVTNFFSRIFFFYLKVEKPLSEEELAHILATSEGRGLLHQEETLLLKGYISLEEKQAIDIMTPRGALAIYDVELPLTKLTFLFTEKKLTAVPVCKGSLDTFLGMLSVKDFLIHRSSIHEPEDLIRFLRKPLFMPEATSLKLLLTQFERLKAKIALIIDEYGAISGAITKDDLMEMLSKPVTSQSETLEYTKVSQDTIIAQGTMPIKEVSSLFHEKLESGYHQVTIGGFLTERLGMIPKNGVIYQEGNLFFRILSSTPTHIRKVYIQQKKEEK